MIYLHIKSSPDHVLLSHGFRAAAEAMQNLTPMMEEIGNEIASVNESAFNSEGGSTESGIWKELSPRYKAWKDVHFPRRPILEATRTLREALTTKTSGEHAIREYGNGTMVFGTRGVAYALAHQEGCGKVPRRAFFDNDEKLFKVKGVVDKAVQRFIVNAERKAGFRDGQPTV